MYRDNKWNAPWNGSTKSLLNSLMREPVFIAYLLMFISGATNFYEVFYLNRDSFAVWGNTDIQAKYGSLMRSICLVWVLLVLLFKWKSYLSKKITIVYLFGFSCLLALNFLQSFSYQAAFSALSKDVIPLSLVLLGIAYKERVYVFAYSVLILAIVNNILQLLITYPLQLAGLLAGRPSFFGDSPFRAAGITDTGTFEFLNFSACLLFIFFFNRKSKRLGVIFFAGMGALSMLAKSVGIFIFMGLQQWLSRKTFLIGVGLVSLLFITPLFSIIIEVFGLRIESYFSTGNTDRTRSYEALSDSISRLNLFGEGLGSFGGPAAAKYGSPLHFEYVSFESKLITTDTYYPHVFIEHGLIGGLIFLAMILLPLFVVKSTRASRKVYYLFAGFLCFASLATFAFEDLPRAMCILPLLAPVLYHQKRRTSLKRS